MVGVSALPGIVLREVNKENWEQCMRLTLSTAEGGLVAPNLYKVLDSKVEASFNQLAIYNADGDMVGFIMFGVDPDDGEYWISRLMIDEDHQGKGYGKAATLEVLKRLKAMGVHDVYVGYRPQNLGAQALFLSIGFERTGQMLQGEFIGKISLEHLEV